MLRIKDIAEIAGVSPTTVSNVIHGNTKKVSKDTIENLKRITEKIVEQERIARKFLAQNSTVLEDTIYRSFGILLYAKRICL